MPDPAIYFENVSFAYQQNLVLKNVSFAISPGEFVGLIGPNGGGKSTLLKLIMGFLTPQSGTLLIDGQAPINARSLIGYVPQTLQFDRQFPISTLEVVLGGCLSQTSWLRFRSKERQKALLALEQVGLASIAERAFGSLSGGQAQRALIARALVSDPKILLLDEPTAMVDMQAEADIYHILSQLKGQMTILMVTHDLQAIVKEVGRVICAQREVTVLQPQEVCEHFAVGLYHFPLLEKVQRSSPPVNQGAP